MGRVIKKIFTTFKNIYRKLVLPVAKNEELAQKEHILYILFLGLLLLAVSALIINVVDIVRYGKLYAGENPFVTVTIILLLVGLFFLSKKGNNQLSARIFLFLLFLLAFSVSFRWGSDSPQALLIYSLLIVMSGILTNARYTFLVLLLCSTATIILAYLEIHGVRKPDYEWKMRIVRPGGVTMFVLTFGMISVVSWLFNKEREKMLLRILQSEKALKKQKDNLEILVEERTQELRQTQVEKLTQLYRFIEFGRAASGLFHDLVTPLNIVSLNLDKLGGKSKRAKKKEVKTLIADSTKNVKRLENFVIAARKQLQNQDELQLFSINHEIMQVVQVLNYKIKMSHVYVVISGKKDIKIYSNPIKFNQLMMNLIANAVDAYEESNKDEKNIAVTIDEDKKNIVITIQDWANGIKREHLSKIFDPLFTTKSYEKGTGIGLAICQNIVHKSLNGTIRVKSQEKKGTTFIIRFPVKKPPLGKIKREKVI